MRRSLLLLIMLTLAIHACEKKASDAPREAPAKIAAPQPIALEDVSNWKMATRLSPDARFVEAFAAVRKLNGKGPVEAKSAYDDGWKIMVDEEAVAEVPELPEFAELLGELEAYAEQNSRPAGSAKPTKDMVESVDMFLSPAVIKALREMNATTDASPEMLELAARAHVYLVVQTNDHLDQADPVASKALALLAMAKATGADMTGEEALLAYELGYSRHARKLAEGLPEDDPIRLYLLAWTRGATEEKLSSSLVERSLYLMAMKQQRHDAKQWWEAVRTHFGSKAPTAATVVTGIHLAKFRSEKTWNGAVLALLEEEIESGKPTGVSLGELPFAGPQHYASSTKTIEGELKPAFDAELEELISQKAGELEGPWLDAETYEAFYRSQTMDRAYRLAQFHANGLASHRSLGDFLNEISASDSPLAGQFKRYFELRKIGLEGRPSEGAARLALQEVTQLGAEPRVEIFKLLTEATAWNSTAKFRAFLEVAGPLDSRPETQAHFGHLLTFYAWDIPGGARISKSLRETNDEIGHGLVFRLARLRSETEVLENAIDDPHAPLSTKLQAIEELADIPSIEADNLEKHFKKLLKTHESSWSLAADYANFLEKHDRSKASVEFLESWIEKHGRDEGFQAIFEATALSDALRKAGKTRRAIQVIEPHVPSWQAGARVRAAMAYEANGEPVRAHKLMAETLERYPDSQWIRSHLVRIPWAQGEYEAAARRLAQSNAKLDWNIFGDAFIETFGEDPDEAKKAIAAMAEAGVSREHIASLGRYLIEEGHPMLAFEATSHATPAAGQQKMTMDLRAYNYLARAKSEEAAKEWLEPKLARGSGGPVPMLMYSVKAYDLIWTWAGEPKEEFNWLVRLAAWIEMDGKFPERKEALMAHYADAKDDKYHTFGRVVLGLADVDSGWKYVKSQRDKAEYTFFLALRELRDENFDEASNLMHETLLTGETRTGEYTWAAEYLKGWADTGKPEPKL